MLEVATGRKNEMLELQAPCRINADSVAATVLRHESGEQWRQ